MIGQVIGSKAFVNINKIYPVGSIYMSMVLNDPADLFGGKWERIEGRFLFGAGSLDSDYPVGDMDGEYSHTLTTSEIPAHRHTLTIAGGSETGGTVNGLKKIPLATSNSQSIQDIASVGGGQPHNNMPPYLCVYMWKRTA